MSIYINCICFYSFNQFNTLIHCGLKTAIADLEDNATKPDSSKGSYCSPRGERGGVGEGEIPRGGGGGIQTKEIDFRHVGF